jgi:hypothetical protein
MIGMYFIEEGMITEEMVDEKLAEMEGGAAGNEPFIRMMRAYKEVFAHNAEVFAAIVEKAKKGEGCMVLLDQSPLLKVYCDIMLEMEPEKAEMVDAYAMSCSQVANVNLLYADIKPEYESSYGEDQMSLILAPVHANPDITVCPIYPSNMVVGVMPDGSLLFEVIEEEQPSSGSGVLTFYAALEEELPEEYKTKNAEAFRAFKFGDMVTCVVIFGVQPVGTAIPSTIEKGETEIFAYVVLVDENGGVSRQIYIVDAEGCSILQATNI